MSGAMIHLKGEGFTPPLPANIEDRETVVLDIETNLKNQPIAGEDIHHTLGDEMPKQRQHGQWRRSSESSDVTTTAVKSIWTTTGTCLFIQWFHLVRALSDGGATMLLQ
jgi:hypothetical protein